MHPENGDIPQVPSSKPSSSIWAQDGNISWYHGRITRDAAEHILNINGGQEGQFLVRESTTSTGDYVLSLIHEGQPIHYQVRRHGEDAFFSIDEGPIVHGLEVLVSFYQEDANGLVRQLGAMCKGQPPPPDTRRHGRTNLLHRATKEGGLTVVGELLKSGYHSLDAKNQDGQTAVHLASFYGYDDVLRMLLRAGASTNIRDSSGLTPLHYACRQNLPNTVRVLMDEGNASPQQRSSKNGWVALHEAANLGHVDVVKILLSYNVPCHPRSDQHRTPLCLALENNHLACASILENHIPPKPKTSRQEWFHSNIDREGTTKKLCMAGLRDGSFLVRNSSRKDDVFVLSMVSNSHMYHFEIHQQGRFYFIDDGPHLESLEHVVEHYSHMADGLPTRLVFPIKPSIEECGLEVKESESVLIKANGDSSLGNPDVSDDEGSSSGWLLPNLIQRESVRLGQPVGEGEFGSVLKGLWINPRGEQVDVALKTLREEQLHSGREEFIREVEVMVGLHHSCIVKLLGVCRGPPLMMVQELVPMGSMLDFLLESPQEIDIDMDLKLWAAQIAWGMMYLEGKRFVHRDLAARNILLASKKQAKISDFGLSRALRAGSEYYRATSGGRWPVKWYSPESINFGTFSHASDVWSYGITLWEMFSFGDQPYGELTGSQVIQLIERGKRLARPQHCPDNIFGIMKKCWEYRPEDRLTFSQLHFTFTTDPEYNCTQRFASE